MATLTATTYKKRLISEIDKMSEVELEKIYKMVVFIKNEFIDEGESRYYTKGWIEAEKEATAAYKKGNLETFDSVKDLANFIEKNVNFLHKE